MFNTPATDAKIVIAKRAINSAPATNDPEWAVLLNVTTTSLIHGSQNIWETVQTLREVVQQAEGISIVSLERPIAISYDEIPAAIGFPQLIVREIGQRVSGRRGQKTLAQACVKIGIYFPRATP